MASFNLDPGQPPFCLFFYHFNENSNPAESKNAPIFGSCLVVLPSAGYHCRLLCHHILAADSSVHSFAVLLLLAVAAVAAERV